MEALTRVDAIRNEKTKTSLAETTANTDKLHKGERTNQETNI